MKTGEYIDTPRFCRVKLTAVFESTIDAENSGYKEPTHYRDSLGRSVLGKHLGTNHMSFAGILGVNEVIPVLAKRYINEMLDCYDYETIRELTTALWQESVDVETHQYIMPEDHKRIYLDTSELRERAEYMEEEVTKIILSYMD